MLRVARIWLTESRIGASSGAPFCWANYRVLSVVARRHRRYGSGNLLERLRDREAQVLRFAHHLTIPFANNQAERDLRPTKTQMKISGTFRSETSATA